jgi:hypothetical protein
MQERGQREEENRNAVAAKREAGKARRGKERKGEGRDEKRGERTREEEKCKDRGNKKSTERHQGK